MKMLRRTLAIVGLLCCTAAAGCVIEDSASVTCDRFETFLADCYYGYDCWAGWYCVDNYDIQDIATQDLLDACADCLYTSPCTDTCYAGGSTCEGLLTLYLDIECW